MSAAVEDRRAHRERQRQAIVRRERERDADEVLPESADLPNPIKPVTVAQVLSETSADVWRRWSQDRAIRAQQRAINAEAERREAANLPIYPRECAMRLAEDTRTVAPDWRHMRPTLGAAWGRLLKAQPELAPDLTKQREATVTAVFNSVPLHLQASVTDLRQLIDLLLMGHEAAAYHVGFEAGRLERSTHVDNRGRIRNGTKPARSIQPDAVLRLGLVDDMKGGA